MKSVRIGAGPGFYGDSWDGAKASFTRGNLQYFASDHLAELTLSILQKDRAADPAAGYCRDLLPMMKDLWPLAQAAGGVRFLSNAGGLNPHGAAQALAALFAKQGWRARIAVVTGDDVLPRLAQLQQDGHAFAQDGVALADASDAQGPLLPRVEFCNAYLGAQALAQALAQGADIVIAGRVADAALFLAPMAHEFGWPLSGPDYARPDNLDRLAQALAMGHLLECSGQACGGNFGGLGWTEMDLAHLAYPIAEVWADGRVQIGKAPETGGRVNFDTLREQLLYEVHDPAAYYSPDLILDMRAISLHEVAPDLMELRGARGLPRPAQAKVVAGYHAGWLGQGMIGYAWPQALRKARFAAEQICARLGKLGVAQQDMRVEMLGHDAILGPMAQADAAQDHAEVWLRLAVRSAKRQIAEALPRMFPPLALSGPPFVAGRMGAASPSQLLGIWQSRLPFDCLQPTVTLLEV
ncbi:acyclic terpene utilization AtuA family protein [Massilia sp. W12]|uniref:acyclic terpene utilization AtuA family protein n=1 Tax=Massilia sp. W12 TaxID=3126507 RepID=UPI0030D5BEC0